MGLLDPEWIKALGQAANSLGNNGWALLTISILLAALRAVWRAYGEERNKNEKLTELNGELERESQRLLTRFEDTLDLVRSKRR